MSSWLSSFGKVTGDLTASVQSAASKVQTAASRVQSAASKVGVDEELIQKLTLRTPELVSERERIDEEERRKEVVKNTLAELLPWETRDEEREILVEECKESILALSAIEETFTTPEPLPGAKTSDLVKKEGDDANSTNDEEAEKEVSAAEEKVDEEEKGEEQKKSAEEVAADAAVKAAEVEAKVAKLAPLPPLLDDFDLDTHVGLIQRLFHEDENLVEKHADLCGAGEREVKFWKNYFFHCAYARYEAGLSIDEIWAVLPASGAVTPAASEGGAETASNHGEETVTFDKSPVPDAGTVQDSVQAPPADAVTASSKSVPPSSSETDASSSSPSPEEAIGGADQINDQVSGTSDFEVVSGSGGGAGDDDLDDLEAEIARELEE